MTHKMAISVNEPYATCPYQPPVILFSVNIQEKFLHYTLKHHSEHPTKTPQTKPNNT